MTNKSGLDSKVFFRTDEIADALGVKAWRVVRFAQVEDYGITPAYGEAEGPGSRRLYSLEDVCEIGLAYWLVEAGLQVKVIGRTLEQVRRRGGLRRLMSLKESDTYLAIVRAPKGDSRSQEVVEVRDWEHLRSLFKKFKSTSALFIPIGMNLLVLAANLGLDWE